MPALPTNHLVWLYSVRMSYRTLLERKIQRIALFENTSMQAARLYGIRICQCTTRGTQTAVIPAGVSPEWPIYWTFRAQPGRTTQVQQGLLPPKEPTGD